MEELRDCSCIDLSGTMLIITKKVKYLAEQGLAIKCYKLCLK